MDLISMQVLRMSEVIQNIRNFAREDRDYAQEDVNVNQAIGNVFSMIGRQFEAHDILVAKSLGHDLPAVQANLNRLEQVIMNLLVNARQALDGCSREQKELRIKTGRQGEAVYIEVADNATGIPPEAIERIFDPFFTTKEVGQGTGLGLTISQSIIREFKGTIDVSNNERGGATFLVTIPVRGDESECPSGRR
jgi:C4-dicarboxylate-specific signal transduction histidine kinase